MHLTEVIIKPILTEKSYKGYADGVYTFVVNKKSNKVQIKKVFEELFEVEVKSVRTMNYSGKDKRVGKFGVGKTNSYKKAIITLKEGQTLEIFND